MADIEDLISCSICMEIFDKPRVLPCQHTFCEQCLNDYVIERSRTKKKNGQKRHFKLPCPLCREKVMIDDSANFGTTFPLNLTVVALCDNKDVMNRLKEKSQTLDTVEENVADDSNKENKLDEINVVPEVNYAHEDKRGMEWAEFDDISDETVKFYSDDVFGDVILFYVLKPIIIPNQTWWKVVRAVLCLLMSMILYCSLVQFAIIHEIKVILTPFLFIVLRNCFREYYSSEDVIGKFRTILYHSVVHIVSTVLTIMLLLCALVCACAVERIVTLMTYTDTADVNMTFKELVYKTLEMTSQSLNNLYVFWLQLNNMFHNH